MRLPSSFNPNSSFVMLRQTPSLAKTVNAPTKNTKPGVFFCKPYEYILAKNIGAIIFTIARKFIKLPEINPRPKPASEPFFIIKLSTASLFLPPVQKQIIIYKKN